MLCSYNIHFYTEINKDPKGLNKFRDFLRNSNVEILFLQESYGVIPAIITKDLPFQSVNEKSGLAILSKHQIQETKIYNFEEDKGVMYAKINDIRFYNVHLDNEFESKRLKQIYRVINFVKSIEDSLKIYIGGDFNTLNPDDYTKEKWDYMLKKESKHTSTRNLVYPEITKWYKDLYNGKKDPVTSIYQRRVDYFFSNVSKSPSSFIDNTIELSDHYPILVKL